MKRLLLFILLLTAYSSVFANLKNGNWRWRNDDGSETSATWKAAENTSITINNMDSLRLRIEVYSTDNGVGYSDRLQYSSTPSDASSWASILNTVGSNAFVLAGTSNSVTDSTPTTQQLTGVTDAIGFTFIPGIVYVTSNGAGGAAINANEKKEYEWVIKPTNNIQTNTTYTFRINSPADIYPNPLPTLTTAATLPVELINFTAISENNRVKLTWSTASELNNDFFEVEKSTDGDIWNVIATIKGKGTSGQLNNYIAYDHQPANGINYYRISQHDFDGTVKKSSIKNVKVNVTKVANVTIYPNPSLGDVYFSIQHYNGKIITASLSTLEGKLIHRENFTINPTVTENKLKLNLQQKPAKGSYMLQVTGDHFSEHAKLIIQ